MHKHVPLKHADFWCKIGRSSVAGQVNLLLYAQAQGSGSGTIGADIVNTWPRSKTPTSPVRPSWWMAAGPPVTCGSSESLSEPLTIQPDGLCLMSKFKVIITDHGYRNVDQEMAILRAAGAELSVAQCRQPEDVIAVTGQADALLVQWAPINAAVLRTLTRCRGWRGEPRQLP